MTPNLRSNSSYHVSKIQYQIEDSDPLLAKYPSDHQVLFYSNFSKKVIYILHKPVDIKRKFALQPLLYINLHKLSNKHQPEYIDVISVADRIIILMR